MNKSFIVLSNKRKVFYETYDSSEKIIVFSWSGMKLHKKLSELSNTNVYNFNNGRIAAETGDSLIIYYSEEDVMMVLKYRPNSQHILFGLNDHGKLFTQKIDDLISIICDIIHIDKKNLNFSENSLLLVEKVLIDKFLEGKIFNADLKNLVFPIIAYVGETIIKNNGGKWEMELYHDQETWIPFIINKGRKFNLPLLIYNSLCNLNSDDLPSITNPYFTVINSKT